MLEYGFEFAGRRARGRVGRHRISGAGRDRPLRIRREPGPRRRRIAEPASSAIASRSASGSHVSLAAFRNDIDQLIEFVVIDPDTFEGENRNVAKARIDGIEAGWQFDGERWAASATATLQDPRDRTTDARLLRRARENFTAARPSPHRRPRNRARSPVRRRAPGFRLSGADAAARLLAGQCLGEAGLRRPLYFACASGEPVRRGLRTGERIQYDGPELLRGTTLRVSLRHSRGKPALEDLYAHGR